MTTEISSLSSKTQQRECQEPQSITEILNINRSLKEKVAQLEEQAIVIALSESQSKYSIAQPAKQCIKSD